ncbi:MAG TPA: fimbria/pilus outer membrane usher protein [Rhizomicrobium sp.]|nr:fimbria/pilus outer membrane usher protein [Rhizomicrobium sp.]
MRIGAAALILAIVATGNAHAAAVFAAATVNGYAPGVVLELDQQGDHFMADVTTLDAIGLIRPANIKRVDIATLPGVRFVFHADTQTIAITADDSALKPHNLGGGVLSAPPDEASLGALVNYGIAATRDSRGATDISGDLEFRAFAAPGVFESRWYGRSSSFRRLDTALIHDDVEDLRTWTAGDFVASSMTWSRPVRAAGLSIATNFAIRPELVTQPMPWLAGAVSVPSTVDLYLNGVHAMNQPVPPGPFTVNQAPIINGEGQVSLAVTDALGRQTVQSFDFYASDELLAPGLTASAFEAGWLREGYGQDYDRYTKPFAQMLARHGLTDVLTIEGRAALTADRPEFGAGFVAKLGSIAVVALSLDDSGFGRGEQMRASLERQTGGYFIRAAITQSFGRFRDVASEAGDGNVDRSIEAGAGFNSDALGSFGLNYTEVNYDRSNRLGIVSASWSRPVADGWRAYATAWRAGSHASGFMVGLSVSPSNGLLVEAGVNGSGGHTGAFANASQWPDDGLGFGWSAQAQSAPVASGQVMLRYTSPFGEAGAGISGGRFGTNASAYATGSIAWLAGGAPHLARQTSSSFAEIDTGMPGVHITLENRAIGETGQDGRLFVPELVPYVPAHIAIDARSVPLDQEIMTPGAIIRPPRDAGIALKLPIRASVTAAVHFILPDGADAALNTPVSVNGADEGAVGYDGVAWLTDLLSDNVIRLGDGEDACTAHLAFDPAKNRPGMTLGPVVCVTPPPGRGR